MTANTLRLSILAMMGASLIGCATESTTQSNSSAPPVAGAAVVQQVAKPLASVTLSGVVGLGNAKASVTMFDAQGSHKSFTTDEKGSFRLVAEGLVPPLMLVAEVGGQQYVSLLTPSAGASTANINALTDWVASAVALNAKLAGPADLVAMGHAPIVKPEEIRAQTGSLQALIGGALKDIGISNNAEFDPASTNQAGVMDLLKLIHANRGYASAQGKRGSTSLYDPNFHEISKFSPLNMRQARADQEANSAAGVVRVFIAGDSTASNYDINVAPRTGWGQVFDRNFKDSKKVRVINIAQSGRSSRSFITEGWFDMIATDIRKGDYLFVQFGHNDEKCGEEPARPAPSRDAIDIANLCTYPGNSANIPAEMSFHKTLEKYISLARRVGATPVLITPVTRRSFTDGKIKGTTHVWNKGKFPGDYSQTVREAAKSNKVSLIDLDTSSIKFFNKLGEEASLNYYLAVDPAKYPFYADQTGNRSKPDNTHFQEKGAEAIAKLVSTGVKENRLALSRLLK